MAPYYSVNAQIKVWALTVLLFFSICAGVTAAWMHFLHTSVVLDDRGFKYNLRVGTSVKLLVMDLREKQIIKHPFLFTLLIRLRGDAHAFKAGEYLFPKGTTPVHLLDQMITGSGMLHHIFIIRPGASFQQLRQALNSDDALEHTTQKLTDTDIMAKLGSPGMKPEGQFFPDSYYFFAESSDLALLKRAFHNMQNKMARAWQHRAPDLFFQTPYEALIAASLIEKEAYLDEERPIISGVMINRLKRNMRLQFDPTVIYGLGDRFDGKIYKHDLTEDTPYNTYVHKGLPPTPIAMPGMKSIEAALHPAVHKFIYFVATGDHASHHFSRSLNEHLVAVAAAKQYRPEFFNLDLIEKNLVVWFGKNSFLSTGISYAPDNTARNFFDHRRD